MRKRLPQKRTPSEKQIENAILQALCLLPQGKFWKNQSVGIYDPVKKSFRSRSKYQIKGVSDILGIYKGKMVCIEVKAAKGRLTPEQTLFLADMKRLGALSGVVRSVSEALDVLKCSSENNSHRMEDYSQT